MTSAASSSNIPRPDVSAAASENWRLLVDSTTGYAIFSLDRDGRVAAWSRGAERITGHRAHEIIGQHYATLYRVEDVGAGTPERELEAASESGHFEAESLLQRKDGSRLRSHVTLSALRDEHGTLLGFGCIVRDLTDTRTVSGELRLPEHSFHHLVDAVVDYAIFMLDRDGHIATWNSGASRLKGYSTEEILGKHFSIFYTPEERSAGKPEAILAAVARDGRYEDEGWRVRKDGTRFWANVIITSLRDESGELTGFAKVTRDLSARRETEEALRRSEERFRLLIENVGDYAIYMLDPEGRVTTWNLGAERMKGYTSEEILGKNFATFFPKEDALAGKPARELATARAHGRFEDEGWRVRKDGTRFWANAILTTIYGGSGTLMGFAKITRDLTSRRAAEETARRLLREQTAREIAEHSERRLRESEERYRALSRRLEIIFEGVGDGITVQDRSGRIVFANAAAATLCGFGSAAELIGTSVAELRARIVLRDEQGRPIDTDDLPARRVLLGEPPQSAIVRVRALAPRRDFWAELRASAVLGPDGEPALAINIWHDVTLQRRQDRQEKYIADATAALGNSLDYDEKLATLASVIVPNLGDFCAIHVLEGEQLRIVAVADRDPVKRALAEEYRRWSVLDPKGARGVAKVLRTGDAELYNEIDDAQFIASAQTPQQLAVLREFGMNAAVIVPIRVEQRVLGVIVLIAAESRRRYDANDVTLLEELGRRAGAALENARLYKAAQDAAAVAEHASRAKDEFLATVSHELRTPLNAIFGWSSLLKDRVKDPAVKKPIEVIHRNAQAQAKIIDDILDVSRVVTGKFRIEPKPTDVVAVVREALDVVRPSAIAKRIELAFTPEMEFCLLLADPERLQQVVWNLLSNAVKFTETGGTIAVALREEDASVTLSVSDNGRGIDPEFLPFVFDRFKQADASTTRRVGGLGLGLAIVRHIVELHGGRASAASPGLGKGTTMSVWLPRRAVTDQMPSNLPVPRAAGTADPKRARALSDARVLVVDDEPDARDLIAGILRDAGAVVELAASAADAYRVLARFRPDVLVSDIAMPGEDGFSLMQRVRGLSAKEGGSVLAVALTALAREQDRDRAANSGYTLHLGKPVDPEVLVSTIANLIAASSTA